jgi:hypothetical protein
LFRNFLEELIASHFKPFRYFLNFRKIIVKTVVQYHAYELQILINHMPHWYKIYESHILCRIFRVGFGLIVLLPQEIVMGFPFSSYLDSYNPAIFIYIVDLVSLLKILGYIYFGCWFIFKMILRLIFISDFFNAKVENKYKNIFIVKQILCIIVINYIFKTVIMEINMFLTSKGYIPPFQYQLDRASYKATNHITQQTGTMDFKNYKFCEGKNLISKVLKSQ